MKITVISATYNRSSTVSQAISSVQAQTHKNIQHIIVDGASTDGTLEIIRSMIDKRTLLVSEPDNGIYDALNKGISLATGDIIGVLHSDDYFADNEVISDVATAFRDPKIDFVYGNLDYVSKSNINLVVRRWVSGVFSINKLKWGWMPPHPTLFVRREIIDRYGSFDTTFRISADYDLVLRYFSKQDLNAAYIPRVLVKMRTGGESNRSLKKICFKTFEDYKALRSNKVGGFGALLWKNLSKFGQFFT